LRASPQCAWEGRCTWTSCLHPHTALLHQHTSLFTRTYVSFYTNIHLFCEHRLNVRERVDVLGLPVCIHIQLFYTNTRLIYTNIRLFLHEYTSLFTRIYISFASASPRCAQGGRCTWISRPLSTNRGPQREWLTERCGTGGEQNAQMSSNTYSWDFVSLAKEMYIRVKRDVYSCKWDVYSC